MAKKIAQGLLWEQVELNLEDNISEELESLRAKVNSEISDKLYVVTINKADNLFYVLTIEKDSPQHVNLTFIGEDEMKDISSQQIIERILNSF